MILVKMTGLWPTSDYELLDFSESKKKRNIKDLYEIMATQGVFYSCRLLLLLLL